MGREEVQGEKKRWVGVGKGVLHGQRGVELHMAAGKGRLVGWAGVGDWRWASTHLRSPLQTNKPCAFPSQKQKQTHHVCYLANHWVERFKRQSNLPVPLSHQGGSQWRSRRHAPARQRTWAAWRWRSWGACSCQSQSRRPAQPAGPGWARHVRRRVMKGGQWLTTPTPATIYRTSTHTAIGL